MRPSSFFSVLAAVAYARPITPFNDSIFDNLRDLIFGSVGGLFSYPYGLYGQASCFAHNFESKLCPAQCVPKSRYYTSRSEDDVANSRLPSVRNAYRA
ncbi:hypothetical protein F5Y14DRAFT_410014 [Nemania sp. NC0429]|nr:hypothetical protein F5Y14DRAFT_410014 [Nemania sp. NC0429]